MAFLVSTAVSRIRNVYPDITEAIALELLNETHQELCLTIPFITTVEDIDLVAGTREYALNEDTLRVWSAEYVTGGEDGQRKALAETDVSELDRVYPGWRGGSRGTPGQFYIHRNATDFVVGFLPTPSATTTGDFPVGRLHVSRRPAALLIGDSLPKGILKLELYVAGALSKWTLERTIPEFELWRRKYVECLAEEKARYRQLSPFKPYFTFPISFRANT